MFKELYNKLLAIKKIVLQNFLGIVGTICANVPVELDTFWVSLVQFVQMYQ